MATKVQKQQSRSRQFEAKNLSFKLFLPSLFILSLILAGCTGSKTLPIKATKEYSTFADWCLHKDELSLSTQITIDAILERVYELTRASDCKQVSNNLVALASLQLHTAGDLTPLKVFPDLVELRIVPSAQKGDVPQISDLSPLRSLRKLKSLDLYSEQITDLSPLSSLKELEYLSITSKSIKDVSPLSSLMNLRTLYIRGSSEITDISSLKSLTNLQTLTVEGNNLGECQIPSATCQLSSP